MRKLAVLLPMLAFALSARTFAADCHELDTQSEMNQCAIEGFQRLDRALNQRYGDYLSRLDERQKRQLKEAQLAWIRFRELACTFESGGVEGGSVYPLVFHYCLSAKTAERMEELATLANCEEGDLSCPAWK